MIVHKRSRSFHQVRSDQNLNTATPYAGRSYANEYGLPSHSLLHCLVYLRLKLSASAKLCIITVQNQLVLFTLRYTDTVIRSCYRRKIDNKKKVILSICTVAHKAENAAETVIGIDPLKALRVLQSSSYIALFFVYRCSSART